MDVTEAVPPAPVESAIVSDTAPLADTFGGSKTGTNNTSTASTAFDLVKFGIIQKRELFKTGNSSSEKFASKYGICEQFFLLKIHFTGKNIIEKKSEDTQSKGSIWSRWPKSVFCIVGNEFCERFNFYGMRGSGSAPQDDSTALYHAFAVLAYFTPLLGALLADGFIGKFHTILWVSLVYAAGSIVLAIAATAKPPEDAHGDFGIVASARWMDLLGLILIGIGTGGIKPCVAPFGADQFPQGDEDLIGYYFSFFYASINAGSLLSIVISPILSIIFLLGSFAYRRVPPKENIFAEVFRVIVAQLVTDVKNMFRVLIMLIPTPLFWTLYDQQGSRWLIQTAEMNYNILGWTMPPALIQAINPILILTFIPLFQLVVYPLCRKLHLEPTPLRKLVAGGIVAAIAFVIAGSLQMFWINPTLPQLPAEGTAHLGFINTLHCPVEVQKQGVDKFKLGVADGTLLQAPDEAWSGHSHNVESIAKGAAEWQFTVSDAKKCGVAQKTWTQTINVPGTGNQYYVVLLTQFAKQGTPLHVYEGTLKKDENAEGLFKINLNDFRTITSKQEGEAYFFCCKGKLESEPQICNPSDSYNFLAIAPKDGFVIDKPDEKISTFVSILPDADKPWNVFKEKSTQPFDPTVEASQIDPIDLKVKFQVTGQGGIYILVIFNRNGVVDHVFTKAVSDNTVSVLWQVPQIAVITAGEILFSITGLEFAYTQVSRSMKSIMQAAWLFCISIGDVIILIVAERRIFANMAWELYFFAGLMLVVIGVEALLAIFFYEYNDYQQEKHDEDVSVSKTGDQGHDNKGADVD